MDNFLSLIVGVVQQFYTYIIHASLPEQIISVFIAIPVVSFFVTSIGKTFKVVYKVLSQTVKILYNSVKTPYAWIFRSIKNVFRVLTSDGKNGVYQTTNQVTDPSHVLRSQLNKYLSIMMSDKTKWGVADHSVVINDVRDRIRNSIREIRISEISDHGSVNPETNEIINRINKLWDNFC